MSEMGDAARAIREEARKALAEAPAVRMATVTQGSPLMARAASPISLTATPP